MLRLDLLVFESGSQRLGILNQFLGFYSKFIEAHHRSPLMNVSEFLQLVGNMAFFVAIDAEKPHGIMESWNVGMLARPGATYV
jgi:hypothetical protein